MEQFDHIAGILALTLGASWASGINLYAAMAVLGFSGASGAIDLPPDLQILENPLVIAAASLMYVVEFVTDKIPGVDTAWDTVHTFIRIPAGALMAAGAVGDVGPALEVSAIILGGGLATVSHVTKAGSRVVINASPEPFTNWGASVAEDVAVIGGLWTALHHPWIFLGLLVLFLLFVAWLLPRIWAAIKKMFGWVGRLFGKTASQPVADAFQGYAGATQQSTDPPPEDEVPRNPEGQEKPVPEPGRMEKFDQLERLKSLYDSGALTEEEFSREKNRILGNGN